MRAITYPLLALIFLFLYSCEEVVHVDVPTAAPRLVIDASLKWQKGTTGENQLIKLTTTTGYYDSTIPTVSGAEVWVTNGANDVFQFTETTPLSGEYRCMNFVPEINQTYQLTVVLNGQTYTATETLNAVPAIDSISQNNEGGFSGTDIEIKTFFYDPANVDNYYLFQYLSSGTVIPKYDVGNDEFTQGNINFGFYSNDKIKSGDQLDITLSGISKRYFEYMNKLILISGGSNGPFSTPSANVKGNIINTTQLDNYALGYFSVAETDFKHYDVE